MGGGGDISIHIDINMNIEIYIIINMNVEDYIRYYVLLNALLIPCLIGGMGGSPKRSPS